MKKYFNKTLATFFTILLVMVPSFTAFAAGTVDLKNNLSPVNITTIEKNMPVVATKSTSTIKISSRATWIRNTTTVLENAYGQKVQRVEEDADYIRFVFKTDDSILSSNIILEDGDNLSTTKPQISMVEYVKPESPKALTVSTKIITYYAWSTGYYIDF